LVLPLIAAIFLITDLMVISILVVLSLITPIFVKYAGIKMLGIELVTLTTILTAVELGPELGAIVGLVLMTAHDCRPVFWSIHPLGNSRICSCWFSSRNSKSRYNYTRYRDRCCSKYSIYRNNIFYRLLEHFPARYLTLLVT